MNFYSRNYIFISLLASSPLIFMVSEASHERRRKWEGLRKGKLSIISYKLSFLLRPDEAKYCWLKNDAPSINFDWRHSWLTHHYWLPYFQKHYAFLNMDYSFLWQGTRSLIGERFLLRTVWLYFVHCSVSTCWENINRQIRRLRKGCQENITIQNLTALILLCLKVS